MSLVDLAERRVLIVGATGEIGRSIARLFSDSGAKLFLHGFSNERVLNDLAADLPGATQSYRADISSETEVRSMFKQIASCWNGDLDAIVCCSGINPVAVRTRELEIADWQRTIDVNLTGVFLCVKHAIPMFEQSGGGKIVIISSIFGVESPVNRAAYSTSKHGLTGLIQTVSKEYGGPPAPIEINALCPGPVWSANVRNIFEQHADAQGTTVEEYVKERVARIPAARFLDTDELARTAAFFCSSESSYINGQLVKVTGGAVE